MFARGNVMSIYGGRRGGPIYAEVEGGVDAVGRKRGVFVYLLGPFASERVVQQALDRRVVADGPEVEAVKSVVLAHKRS